MAINALGPLGRESLSDLTYGRLRAAIVSGDLAPGSRFKDVDIAAQLGVSRTPVREALKRLADQGLVEMVPGARTRVTPVTAQTVSDAFPVVAALHALAVRLADGRVDDDALGELRDHQARLRRALEGGELAAAIEADDAFHAVAVRLSGNDELRSALGLQSGTAARAAHLHLDADAAAAMAERNDEVLATLAERRTDAASALVEQDWLALGRALAACVEQQAPAAD